MELALASGQDWAADFWPLTTGASTDTFSNIMGASTTSSPGMLQQEQHPLGQATFEQQQQHQHHQHQQPPPAMRTVGTGLTLGRLDLLGQKVVAASSSTSTASTTNTYTPQPSPSPGRSTDTKRRGSDTARKDRSNVLKAYLMDVGCTKIRGARKRRKNDEGEFEGGKVDWDSEWVQEQLVIPLEEFNAIRLDYERRSKEKKLADATIERDWVTKDGSRIPKAKMLKNYYPTNLILHRFFDLMYGRLLRAQPISASVEEQMQSINPFLKTRPLAVFLLPMRGADDKEGGGNLKMFREGISRSDPMVMNYSWEKDVIEIDGRYGWEEQRAVLARPNLRAVTYLDELLVKGVAEKLRVGVELTTLWLSAFEKWGARGEDEGMGEIGEVREVDLAVFLSCFSEELRGTLRYLLCGPYEYKQTVTIEEFQAFFVWAAGLTGKAASIKVQLAALVACLKRTEGEGREIGRENICMYITTRKAKELKRPGDFYLRASNTQPGWIALEYIPPFPSSPPTSGVGPTGAGFKIEGVSNSSCIQTSLFYFEVTTVNEKCRLTFIDRHESHPNITSLILKHTGSDTWARLRQCAAIRAPVLPPPLPSPATTKELMLGMMGGMNHMMATPFGAVSELSPHRRQQYDHNGSNSSSNAGGYSHSSGCKVVSATQGLKVDGAGMLMPSPVQRKKLKMQQPQQQQQQQPPQPQHHHRSSSRRRESLDSLGLPPCLSNLDLHHSFGIGPSWCSIDYPAEQQPQQQQSQQQHHQQHQQHQQQSTVPHSKGLLVQQLQYQRQQQQQPQEAAQLSSLPALPNRQQQEQQQDHHLLHPQQACQTVQLQQHPVHSPAHLRADGLRGEGAGKAALLVAVGEAAGAALTTTSDSLGLSTDHKAAVVAAAGGMGEGMEGGVEGLEGGLFRYSRGAASLDRLQQQGGELEDPFPLQDFLVSSSSSFGSLGLSSSMPATPAGGEGGGLEGGAWAGNRFFSVDQLIKGVEVPQGSRKRARDETNEG
ncbi:hypothetical protein VYU27_005645 [Nannochloropsis oceanica]